MPKQIFEISASSWFYYKEICYDARSHERKITSVLRRMNDHHQSFIARKS